MIGPQNLKMDHVTQTTPLSWTVYTCRLGLATIIQITKFEVSYATGNEGMKVNTVCRKWGVLNQLGVTQGHWK